MLTITSGSAKPIFARSRHGMEPGRAEFKGVKDVDEIGGEAETHSDAVPVRVNT